MNRLCWFRMKNLKNENVREIFGVVHERRRFPIIYNENFLTKIAKLCGFG